MTGYELILKAARYAADAHRGATRKYSDIPFIVHPMRVASMVMLHEIASPETIAAGWLHDVVEDTPRTLTDIEVEFSKAVAMYVCELTNDSKAVSEALKAQGKKGMSRHDRKLLDNQRLAKVSRPAKVIKLIDSLDNIREVDPRADPTFARIYAAEMLERLNWIGDADLSLAEEVRLAATRLNHNLEALAESTI